MDKLFSLASTGAAEWSAALDELHAAIHPVDRDATRIWFHFFPLALADAWTAAADHADLVRRLRLQGAFNLASARDTSHWFLYGHRYWPAVRQAVLEWASTASPAAALSEAVRRVADAVARATGADTSLTLGISFIGLMTLRQIGHDAFAAGAVTANTAAVGDHPDQIVAARERDDSQGLLGFLRGPRTRFSVRFDERRADAAFTLINQQDLTMAAATDRRDYLKSPRPSREGPIPTDCRSASCGTCWVGILGGREKLADMDDLERRRLREFGYSNATEAKPIIRLACMARASGNVTIVIPSWNGVIGSILGR